MSDSNIISPDKDQLARIIVLLYGMMEGGKPFWVYAAVKPSQYDDFNAAKSNGTLKLDAFEAYGEIIIAGEGQTPPVEVTLKIAEVYQTDPNQLFEDQNPTAQLTDQLGDKG